MGDCPAPGPRFVTAATRPSPFPRAATRVRRRVGLRNGVASRDAGLCPIDRMSYSCCAAAAAPRRSRLTQPAATPTRPLVAVASVSAGGWSLRALLETDCRFLRTNASFQWRTSSGARASVQTSPGSTFRSLAAKTRSRRSQSTTAGSSPMSQDSTSSGWPSSTQCRPDFFPASAGMPNTSSSTLPRGRNQPPTPPGNAPCGNGRTTTESPTWGFPLAVPQAQVSGMVRGQAHPGSRSACDTFHEEVPLAVLFRSLGSSPVPG